MVHKLDRLETKAFHEFKPIQAKRPPSWPGRPRVCWDPHNASVLYYFMLSRYWEEGISWQHNPDSGEEQVAWHTGYTDVVIVPSSWHTAVDSRVIVTNLVGMKIL